jgi:hypothetical protein
MSLVVCPTTAFFVLLPSTATPVPVFVISKPDADAETLPAKGRVNPLLMVSLLYQIADRDRSAGEAGGPTRKFPRRLPIWHEYLRFSGLPARQTRGVDGHHLYFGHVGKDGHFGNLIPRFDYRSFLLHPGPHLGQLFHMEQDFSPYDLHRRLPIQL